MKKNTWGIVLTGGEAPPIDLVRPLIDGAGRIIAADSGLDLAIRYGVSPDLVVGDMDSVSDMGLINGMDPDKVRVYSHEKDDTDTEIALQELDDDGFGRIILLGGGGGRLDHLFAIYALFEREVRPYLWVTDVGFALSVDSQAEIKACAGKQISFFPTGKKACRMRSSGLQWSLDELQWRHGDCGVSNRIVGDLMQVSMLSGRLIMVGELSVLPGVSL